MFLCIHVLEHDMNLRVFMFFNFVKIGKLIFLKSNDDVDAKVVFYYYYSLRPTFFVHYSILRYLKILSCF